MDMKELRKAAEELVSVHFDDPVTDQEWADILVGLSFDKSDIAKSVRSALLVATLALPKLLTVAEAATEAVADHFEVCAECGVGKCDLCYALRGLESKESADAK